MKNSDRNPEKENVTGNYGLKSEAVENLVQADQEEVPSYPEEELNKYRSKSKLHIPETVKILFIKAWFAGAVCYFILWGLGTYVSSTLDMMFVLAICLGMMTDLLLNNVIRFIEKTPGANDQWLFVRRRGVVGFFLNILYGTLVLLCVYVLYNLINILLMHLTGKTDTVFLGVEPFLFGVFCMGFDMLFIGIRRIFQSILADAKKTARMPR